jgi:hypothetical protein
MGKNQDPYPGSGSGMNSLDHISECLETIFRVKILWARTTRHRRAARDKTGKRYKGQT